MTLLDIEKNLIGISLMLENRALLYIGCEMFFEFARANGVIDTTVMNEW